MEQAAREVAHDTVAATQAVMAQYQAELDAARQQDDEVNQQARVQVWGMREIGRLAGHLCMQRRLCCCRGRQVCVVCCEVG